MEHHKWTKMVPSTWREGRCAIRSMLWVNRDVEAEQVRIESPDLTGAVIRLLYAVVRANQRSIPIDEVGSRVEDNQRDQT
ncbi:reverse transcriptase [Penicillium hordei]|uniref:Reverse transcriptase n=1 Tax=Penicillium hordei TaxID=40994 RepID=A0AAD6GXN9_9EURO|nr:reverse transcriptase [Penicillium hordei]KAJ5593627.1 reverse transcriptase [Penicillium hordei]